MRQELFRDVLTVFVTWYLIAMLFSSQGILEAGSGIVATAAIWTVGGVAGAALAIFVNKGYLYRTRRAISKGTENPVARAEIMDTFMGKPTLIRVALPRTRTYTKAAADEDTFSKYPWWPEYQQQHPEYAKALVDVLATMEGRPGLPAGIDKHHGVSLVEHSLDVMAKILELAPTWQYEGIINPRGMLIRARIDDDNKVPFASEECRAAIAHPTLVLAAFAHDLGKVVCLETKDGKGVHMLSGHGEKGAMMLRSLRSVMDLPMAERDAVLLAVKYYHHPFDIPLPEWIGDIPRALTMLLREADLASSGNKSIDKGKAETTSGEAGAEVPQVMSAEPTRGVDIEASNVVDDANEGTLPWDQGDDEIVVPEMETGSAEVAEDQVEVSEPQERELILANGASVADACEVVFAGDGAINGKSQAKRIAFRYGGWAYVLKDAFCAKVAEFAGDKMPVDRKDGQGRVLRAVLRNFGEAVYQGDGTRSIEEAIWKCYSSSTGDQNDASGHYEVFVIRASVHPAIESTPHANFPPTLLGKDAGELGVPHRTAKNVASNERSGRADNGNSMGGEAASLQASMEQAMKAMEGKADTETAREQEEQAPPLTGRKAQQTLKYLATREDAPFGCKLFQTESGHQYASFDAAQLVATYALDIENLPKGISLARNNTRVVVDME